MAAEILKVAAEDDDKSGFAHDTIPRQVERRAAQSTAAG
jgi:hypothetical protein